MTTTPTLADRCKLHQYLANRVTRGLYEKGWTQKKLAAHTGISAGYVSRLLSGRDEGRVSHWDRMIAAVEGES